MISLSRQRVRNPRFSDAEIRVISRNFRVLKRLTAFKTLRKQNADRSK